MLKWLLQCDIMIKAHDKSFFRNTREFALYKERMHKKFNTMAWSNQMSFVTSIIAMVLLLAVIIYCLCYQRILWYCMGKTSDLLYVVNFLQEYSPAAASIAMSSLLPHAEAKITIKPLELPPTQSPDIIISGDDNTLVHSIVVICCVLQMAWISLWAWKLLKKFRYWSNVLRALFPCAPGSRWLNTEVHMDIFLQIINVTSAKVVWAKLTSMAGLPENFVQRGSFNVDAIDMSPICCGLCAKLDIEWGHTVLYDKVTNTQVHLPRSVWTSVFLPQHYINKDDWHLYCVQLHACMLDLFVPIKVESYDSAMGSVLWSTGVAATSLQMGLSVQLPEASAPSRQEVLQELHYEPAPYRALKELR